MEEATLDARLLGGFYFTWNGAALTNLTQSRQQSLLAYLMLRAAGPQSRQQVAYAFWPALSEERAYSNLRYILHHIRRACPQLEPYLEITQSTLQWRRLPSFRLDIAEYEAMLKRAASAGPAQRSGLLIQAADLYRGDLLPDCYEDWIIPERERLRQSHLLLLRQVIDDLAHQHDYQSAIDYAILLRNSDPFQESAYRSLMELHQAIGDRTGALRIYHDCLSMLERELGVQPAPETPALYERIVNPAPNQSVALRSPTIPASTGEKFVGRQVEWQQLQKAWQATKDDHPHLVLLQGEAGIGKTRLAEELLRWAKQQGDLTVRTRAYAAEGHLAYAPVIGWLRAELYQDNVHALAPIWLVELARLLPELLSDFPHLPHPTPLTDSWQRQRLFEALAHAALSLAQKPKRPLLVLIDDLQWADQETLEWLHFLLRFELSAPLLLVGTARMEEVDSAHPLTTLLMHLRHSLQVSEIELRGLDEQASAELAQYIANQPLDAEILADLYAYAEGVPLFLVEAVRAATGNSAQANWPQANWHSVRATQSTPSHAPLAIPPRVYAVLQARLAQLSPQARLLAEVAAVIGRSFSVEFLTAVSDTAEMELIRALDELWKRRIIRERGIDYDISHDRIRDVTYAEISPIQRRLLHRRVAQALEKANAADLDAVSAQLAWHYEHAGAPKRAIDFYQRAGMAAQRIYAIHQAIDLLSKGLALLEEIPASPERDQMELPLQIALGAAARTKSYVAPEVNQALSRALELSRKIDGSKQHFWLLWALTQYHLIKAELSQCQDLSHRLLILAEQQKNASYLVVANTMAAIISFVVGDLPTAQSHFIQSSSLYSTAMHEEQVLNIGFDFGAVSIAGHVHTLWCLGCADQAQSMGQKAIELSQQLVHHFSHLLALDYQAMFHQFRRARGDAQSDAEAALALATRYDSIYYGAWAAILVRWAQASAHPAPQEIADLQNALDDFRATGSVLRLPYYLSLLAEVYGKAGQPAMGLTVVDEALAIATANGEHWWEAELHRLRGELILAQGADITESEAAFQRALDIARQQKALALELRAATSLARLWQTNRRDQAHQLLSAVYAQFSEGFDTLDLQEATSLLSELA